MINEDLQAISCLQIVATLQVKSCEESYCFLIILAFEKTHQLPSTNLLKWILIKLLSASK